MRAGKMNWIAIVLLTLFRQLLGFVWYGAFAAPWMAAIGKQTSDFEGGSSLPYLYAVVAAFVVTYVLARVINAADDRTAVGGLKWGVVVWAGFIFPFAWMHDAFTLFPFKLTLINTGMELVALGVSGLVLGAWRPKSEKRAA